MRERPAIFIGSSTEGRQVAAAIQVLLDRTCEVEVWNQGVFGLSQGSLESLVAALDRFDFAILVLTADDLVVARGDSALVARDNVLFELGLFIGGLGRERTFIVTNRAAPPKLPTDLIGITVADYEPHKSGNLEAALGAPCTKIERHIDRLGVRQSKVLRGVNSAANQLEEITLDTRELAALLARSRVVELDILSQQFSSLIAPDKLKLLRRDLRELETRLDDPLRHPLGEKQLEILGAALPTGALYVFEVDQAIYPIVRAGTTDFGDIADPESLAEWYAAFKGLQEMGYVEHVSGKLYRLTRDGLLRARRLKRADESSKNTSNLA